MAALRVAHLMTLTHAPVGIVVGLQLGQVANGWSVALALAWFTGLVLVLTVHAQVTPGDAPTR